MTGWRLTGWRLGQSCQEESEPRVFVKRPSKRGGAEPQSPFLGEDPKIALRIWEGKVRDRENRPAI